MALYFDINSGRLSVKLGRDEVGGVGEFTIDPIDWIISGEYLEVDVTHNFGSTSTSVEIRDGSGKRIFPDSVSPVDSNTVKVRMLSDGFSSPIVCRVSIN